MTTRFAKATQVRPKTTREKWHGDHRDWLFDGYEIKSEIVKERFYNLDWSDAWVDTGPSIAGNPGPYWHVALPSEETRHRLYPKLITNKRWGEIAYHAAKGAFETGARHERNQILEDIGKIERKNEEAFPENGYPYGKGYTKGFNECLAQILTIINRRGE